MNSRYVVTCYDILMAIPKLSESPTGPNPIPTADLSEVQQLLKLFGQVGVVFDGSSHFCGASSTRHQLVVAGRQFQDLLLTGDRVDSKKNKLNKQKKYLNII